MKELPRISQICFSIAFGLGAIGIILLIVTVAMKLAGH